MKKKSLPPIDYTDAVRWEVIYRLIYDGGNLSQDTYRSSILAANENDAKARMRRHLGKDIQIESIRRV